MTDESPDNDGHDALTLLFRALVLTGTFLWTAARALGVGIVTLGAVLNDRDRKNGIRRWVLLEGNRWTLTWAIVAATFIATFLLAYFGIIGVSNRSFVSGMFGAVISGLFSFVPIVIAVNQLTVSQLFDSPDGMRAEIESVREFRENIEARKDGLGVAPTEPGPFVLDIAELVVDRAHELHALATETEHQQFRERVNTYVEVVLAQMAEIEHDLDGTNQPLIEVLEPIMGDGYSKNITEARNIRHTFGVDASDRAGELLEEMEELFIDLDVARSYFKALYVQQELSRLSRYIGYTGLASFFVSLFLITLFANGVPLGGHPVLLDGLLSISLALVTLPFAVLIAFLIRVATIAKRTAAPGAFTPLGEKPDYVQHRE